MCATTRMSTRKQRPSSTASCRRCVDRFKGNAARAVRRQLPPCVGSLLGLPTMIQPKYQGQARVAALVIACIPCDVTGLLGAFRRQGHVTLCAVGALRWHC
jgi:hypothetical protein